MLEIVDQYAPEIIPYIKSLPYAGGGILPSELLAMLAICRAQDVHRVLESGRHYAYSTRGFAGFLRNVESTDIEPLPEVDEKLTRLFPLSLSLHCEDARRFLSEKFPTTARTLLFLDGPKGKVAVRLVKQYISQLVCGVIHDMSIHADGAEAGDVANVSRIAALESGLPVFFTDDPLYVEKYGYLDSAALTPEYIDRKHMTRHGFTLGIFLGGQWKA